MPDQSHEMPSHAEEVSPATSNPPPADGRQAYVVLAGCVLLQLPIWSFTISYGVFRDYYVSPSTAGQIDGDLSQTGIIGTTLNGIMYMSMPILFGIFTNRLACYRRHAAFLGALLAAISLMASSFARSVWQLTLTQGVLQAIGSTVLYSSTTIYLDEWFIRRKGFAYGVILSTKSTVGVGVPLLFGHLLSELGFRTTLRIWSAVTICTALPAIMFLRPRQPLQASRPRDRRLSWSFLRHPTFYIFQLANIVFSASYGMPQTYLSSFASDVLGFSTATSALILAALNAPSIVACFWFGLLSDGGGLFRQGRSLPIATVSLLSATGACLPVFLLWGLIPGAKTVGIVLLTLFAILYGFFAGGWSATWGGVVKEVQREAEAHNEAIDTGLVYGLLNGGRGIGFVAGGLIGVELLKTGAVNAEAAENQWAYGSSYGSLIIFTGVGAALSGVSVLCKQRQLLC
ncbi:putative monocarboxylate transporter [Biscogniauxia marginata]|nr:putative monocarboxylate transporter [Biscogniauxia marginata]